MSLYFDYDNQAWVRDGRYQRCGHPDSMRCQCFGRLHEGEEAEEPTEEPATFDQEFEEDRSGFADPGGRSALRAATAKNPRNLACPTCGGENRLTAADVRRGYQCNRCADGEEGIF